VLLKTKFFKLATGLTPKLAPRWVGPFKVLVRARSRGFPRAVMACPLCNTPFKVVHAVGPYKLAYKLELPEVVKRMHPTFHVSALRPYLRSGPYQPPPLPDFIDNEVEYSVAFVSDTREWGRYKTRQYRVHWEGYQDQDTWEPLSMLTNCADKIREFWRNKGEPCPHDLSAET